MIRAATPLDIVGWLFTSLLVGSIAGRIAKHFGAPLEVGLVVFAISAAIGMAICYVGRKAD